MGISQEDIDNLVSGSAKEGEQAPPAEPETPAESDTPSEAEAKTGTEEDVRGKYRTNLAGHISNIFTTLCGEDVKVEDKGETLEKGADLGTVLTGELAGFVAPLEFGAVFPVAHVITDSLARMIAGKIMGQDTPESLSEEHFESFKEGLDNLTGAWATGLQEILGIEAKPGGDIEPIGDTPGEALAGKEGFSDDKVHIWNFKVVVGETEGEYKVLIPEKPTKEMVMAHPDYSVDSPGQGEPAPTAVAEDVTPQIPVEKAEFQQFEGSAEVGSSQQIQLLLDVPLTVSVELGRKRISIKEVLDLVPGSLLELEKLAGEPVDLMVNGKLFALGEVVVIDENFGVRISSIVSAKERLDRLK